MVRAFLEEHAHKYTYLHYLKISLFTLRLVVILLLFGSEKGISIKKILSILLEKGLFITLAWATHNRKAEVPRGDIHRSSEFRKEKD